MACLTGRVNQLEIQSPAPAKNDVYLLGNEAANDVASKQHQSLVTWESEFDRFQLFVGSGGLCWRVGVTFRAVIWVIGAPFRLRYSRQRQDGSSGDVQYQETTCTTVNVVIQDVAVCADALAAQSETRVQRRSTRCLVADGRRCIVAGPAPGSSPVDHSDQIARSALSHAAPPDPVTERSKWLRIRAARLVP